MIPASLEQITEKTLQELVANAVREKHTIDYKIAAYGNDYPQHREFLADISSFANTVGGDLIVGVEEDGGLPVGLPGLSISNADDEFQRLQQIILHGLQPRLTGVGMRPVGLTNGNIVLVIRVPHSWNAPHRVTLKGHDKFYARDTNGKHPMNVDELRGAFTLADRVEQRIRAFRRERFQTIKANQSFEPLSNGAMLVLHVIPLSAATMRDAFDLKALKDKVRLIKPIGIGGNYRVNLDGVILYANGVATDGGHRASVAYTQLYRNGTIEAVRVFEQYFSDVNQFPSVAYERWLIEDLGQYLQAQRELGITPPVYIFLGFANAGKYQFPIGDRGQVGHLDRDDIELGERVIENLSEEPVRLLLPLFNQVWQAFGFERSFNFDEAGKWIS
jgi:hypothetical protein